MLHINIPLITIAVETHMICISPFIDMKFQEPVYVIKVPKSGMVYQQT